jgi:hypothetical protein
MIPGLEPIRQIQASFQIHPFTALLGLRRCGKTTLARHMSEQEPTTFFDLENPVDIQRLSAPVQTLRDLSGLVILDEVQRKPELFELFRVVADRSDLKTRFLLLGSAFTAFGQRCFRIPGQKDRIRRPGRLSTMGSRCRASRSFVDTGRLAQSISCRYRLRQHAMA